MIIMNIFRTHDEEFTVIIVPNQAQNSHLQNPT